MIGARTSIGQRERKQLVVGSMECCEGTSSFVSSDAECCRGLELYK
jgi:hypothetical protein